MAEGRRLKSGGVDRTRKNRLELLPYDALWEVGKVYTFGSYKYGDRAWDRGVKSSRLFGALLRHCVAWWCGEEKDEESGVHHLAHAIADALMLLSYDIRGLKKFDDRPRNTKFRKELDFNNPETDQK